MPVTEPLPPASTVPPPRSKILAYRLLGLRMPEEHVPWVVEDTRSRSFLAWRSLRTFLWGQVFVALLVVGMYLGKDTGDWPARMTIVRFELAVLAVMLFSSREALVRRALRWHRVDKHGNPAPEPKGFARFGNKEAVLVGVLALVAWTAGSTVFGVGLRPTGVAAVPCREAEPAVMDRITAGKTNAKAVYITTRMVRYEGTDVVLAVTDLDGNLATPSPGPTPAPRPSGSPAPRDD